MSQTPLQNVISQLQQPVLDNSLLLALLCAPLDVLGLLPKEYRKFNINPIDEKVADVVKHIARLQHIILQSVVPVWSDELQNAKETVLVEQYFVPTNSSSVVTTGVIVQRAYSSILSLPLDLYSIRILETLVVKFPTDKVYGLIERRQLSPEQTARQWEDYLKDVCSVPSKVANYYGQRKQTVDTPQALEYERYFNLQSLCCERLILSASHGGENFQKLG